LDQSQEDGTERSSFVDHIIGQEDDTALLTPTSIKKSINIKFPQELSINENEIPTDESPFGDESEETKESDMKLKEKLTDLCKLNGSLADSHYKIFDMIQSLGSAIENGNLQDIQTSFSQLKSQATENLKIADKVEKAKYLKTEEPIEAVQDFDDLLFDDQEVEREVRESFGYTKAIAQQLYTLPNAS